MDERIGSVGQTADAGHFTYLAQGGEGISTTGPIDERQAAYDQTVGQMLREALDHPIKNRAQVEWFNDVPPEVEGAATLFVNLEQLIVSEIAGLPAGPEKEDFRACARRIIAIVRGFTP